MSLTDWEARCAAHHDDEIVKGLHDDECEYDHRSPDGAVYKLCHCSKRRREREDFLTPPDADLEFSPACPHCGGDCYYEDQSWRCDECSLAWDRDGSGSSCEFTDDYGELPVADASSTTQAPAPTPGQEHEPEEGR